MVPFILYRVAGERHRLSTLVRILTLSCTGRFTFYLVRTIFFYFEHLFVGDRSVRSIVSCRKFVYSREAYHVAGFGLLAFTAVCWHVKPKDLFSTKESLSSTSLRFVVNISVVNIFPSVLFSTMRWLMSSDLFLCCITIGIPDTGVEKNNFLTAAMVLQLP